MDFVERHYCNASSRAGPALGDAKELLYVLRDGIERRNERHEAVNFRLN